MLFCLLSQISFGQTPTDTIYLNGKTKTTFSLGKTIPFYYIDCIQFTTRTTSRSISGVGTVVFKSDGSGYITPSSAAYTAKWDYYVSNCGYEKRHLFFMQKPTIPPPPANKVPIPISDAYTIDQDATLSENILINDSDPDSDPITVASFAINGIIYSPGTQVIPSVGTITILSSGALSFLNAAGITGDIPIISYLIKDSKGAQAASSVLISVKSKPTLPPNTFVLDKTSTTSAGVYIGNKLIRTLWNNVSKPAGTYTVSWDGKDDAGNTAPPGGKIAVLYHQMTYQWKASIGNSSRVDTGSHKLRGLRTPFAGVEAGGYIYICKGNTEGNSPIFKIAKSDPQYMYSLRESGCGDCDMQTEFVASDGNLVYWAGYDAWTGYWPVTNKVPPDTNSRVKSIIYATKVSDDQDYTFPSGKKTKASLAACNTYSGIGIVLDDDLARPTGLAVMSTGNYLYSTHLGKSWVRCYNKTTGSLIRTMVNTLSNIAIDGNYLYGISGSTIKKYAINSDGTLTDQNVNIAMQSPLNISVKNGTIMVIEAATQQVLAYNTSGVLQWTLGQSGGYKSNPYVSADRFNFIEFNRDEKKGFIIPQADGSFWVGDAGNCRTIHFAADRTYIENVAYLPTNYNCGVDQNAPTRVFAGFLEYDGPTGTLVANWSANLTANYNYIDNRAIFSSIQTILGRTYGLILYYPNPPSSENVAQELVELTSTGIRFTGIRRNNDNRYVFDKNGDLLHPESDYYALSGTGKIIRERFTGINTSGNPTFSAPETLYTFPLGKNYPSYASLNYGTNAKGIVFSDHYNNTGYHLGRIENGQWIWMTCKSTSRNYTGDMPTDGTFDCGNGTQYAGWNLYNIDSFFVWSFHGEFWKNSQTNIWNLFHEDGLMLMQLGKTGPQADIYNGGHDAPREAAGNMLGGQIVKIGNDYWIFYCDESRHGAIHYFRISGANTVKIIYLK